MKKLSAVLASFMAIVVILAAQQVYAAKTTKEISPHPLGQRSVQSERAISERIAPSAKVCIQGIECEAAVAAAAAAAAAGPRSGEEVYNNTGCAGCHSGALPNAPAKGQPAVWKKRAQAAGGLKGLVKNAISGTTGGMPPKGGCGDCSDDEIKAAVQFMMK